LESARTYGPAWLLTVARAAVAGLAWDADWQCAGFGGVDVVEVNCGDDAVEADGFVRHRERQRDSDVGADDAALGGGDGRAGLTAAVDRVDRRRLRCGADRDAEVDVAEVASRSGELEFGRVVTKRLGFVEELGACRVATGAAVVVGRVPVGESDEEDRVDGFGDVGVAEPDLLSAFFATCSHPGCELGPPGRV